MDHKIEFSPEALADLIDLYYVIAERDAEERAIASRATDFNSKHDAGTNWE